MATRKPAHHKGTYHVLSRRMNAQANADPTATCWRDGLTLAAHGPGKHWTCGHVDNPDLYARHPSPYATRIDGRLCAPEVSRCNYSNGASEGNKRRAGITLPTGW